MIPILNTLPVRAKASPCYPVCWREMWAERLPQEQAH
nr:MAG TPA: hypothetical protein [Caudoviricetes sp.]